MTKLHYEIYDNEGWYIKNPQWINLKISLYLKSIELITIDLQPIINQSINIPDNDDDGDFCEPLTNAIGDNKTSELSEAAAAVSCFVEGTLPC